MTTANATRSELTETEPPIALTSADIEEFRSLVESETGVKLDTVAAWNRATELVALVRMLVGPMPEDTELRAAPTRVLPSLPACPG